MQAGLWLIPQNVAMVVGSLIAPAIANRVNPTYVTAAGLGPLVGLGVSNEVLQPPCRIELAAGVVTVIIPGAQP